MPAAGLPLMYGALGSLMPYGGLYFIARPSWCASHRAAGRQARIIEDRHRVSVRPTTNHAFKILRQTDCEQMVDPALTDAAAKPRQARILDVNGPHKPVFGEHHIPTHVKRIAAGCDFKIGSITA